MANKQHWDGYPHKKMPPDCPVKVLGKSAKGLELVDSGGEKRLVKSLSNNIVADLFAAAPDFPEWAWPRFDKEGRVTGLAFSDLSKCFYAEAARQNKKGEENNGASPENKTNGAAEENTNNTNGQPSKSGDGSGSNGGAGSKSGQYPQEMITQIAMTCHDNNRAYCQMIGDNSQVPWPEAEDWQQASAMDGVRFAIDNDFPAPADMHENWMKDKAADGWVYGEVKDPDNKTHPCMVPYDQLPEDQREKDRIFTDTVKVMVRIYDEGAPDRALIEIDAASYAASVGHAAAGRIYRLMSESDDDWFIGGENVEERDVTESVMALATYLESRKGPVHAETLYRFAKGYGLHGHDLDGFDDCAPGFVLAWQTFCEVTGLLLVRIGDEQQKARARLQAENPQDPTPKKRRESVFEGHGSMLEKN